MSGLGFEDFRNAVAMAQQPAKDRQLRRELERVIAGLGTAIYFMSNGEPLLAQVAVDEARTRALSLMRRVGE